MKFRLVFATIAAGALLTACGGSSDSSTDTQAVTTDSASAGSTEEVGNFNDADVMFAQMMIPHHEQAIEMSDIALDPAIGASDVVKDLASRIKAAQDPEIAQMKALLTSWGQPLTSEDGMDHSSMMGGMMSTEDMSKLGSLAGAEFDAMWAKSMIAHHEGAVIMANEVLEDGANGETRALAETIIAAQQAEIEELTPIAGE